MRQKNTTFKSNSTSKVANFLNREIKLNFNDVSQGTIAEACGYAYKSANYISMVRSGKSKLPIERAVRMANFLKVPADDLVLMCFKEYHEAAYGALDELNLVPHTPEESAAISKLLEGMREGQD